MSRGVITTTTLVSLGVGVIMTVGGFFAKAWFTETSTSVTLIKQAQVEKYKLDAVQDLKIAITETKIDGIDKRTTRMEEKMDLLLKNQGIYYREKLATTTIQ